MNFYYKIIYMFVISAVLIIRIKYTRADDWSLSCASNCTCKWTNGKKSAICNSLQLTTIPTTLSTELQVLYLNDNHISYLNREEFTRLGLLNLQRVYLKKSNVQYIHKETFKNLKILVEIDLSENKIEMLDKDTFIGNDRLRILYLNGNPLRKLIAYQFPILPHLRTLDLHNCLIAYIDPMALANLDQLEFLHLKNNLLKNLSEFVFQHMINLKTLTLDDNPWECNCKLRKFRSWYVNSRLNSLSLTCAGPAQYKQKQWQYIDEEQFGCQPTVEIFNNEDVQNIDVGSNTTFSCLVYGDPIPDVSWELNGKLLDSENVIFDIENISSDKLWSNLTIFNMTILDAGTYVCTGTNTVGATSQNISIYLTEIVQHVLIKTPETFWYFGLIIGTFGTIFILILISFFVCLCKRTTRHRRHPIKSKVKASVSFNEQEKKLLDLSITTTNDRGDSCGIDNNTTSISKTESIIGFEPVEIHSIDNYCKNHNHQVGQQIQQHHVLISNTGNSVDTGNMLANRAHQVITVTDGSSNFVGIPTGIEATTASLNEIADKINVGIFPPPPPEFSSSNLTPNTTYGNIFISVSVTNDMLNGTDINIYPDLINIPKRLQDSNKQVAAPSSNVSNNADVIITATSAAAAAAKTATTKVNISSFATLPRNIQRHGLHKNDASLQSNNLYSHNEIISYNNLELNQNQHNAEYRHANFHLNDNNMLCSTPPPQQALPQQQISSTSSSSSSAAAAAIMGANISIDKYQKHHQNDITVPIKQQQTCNECIKPLDNDETNASMNDAHLHPLCKSECPKYDNMGPRITAAGNSTLSLTDDENLKFGEFYDTMPTDTLLHQQQQQQQQQLQQEQNQNNRIISKNLANIENATEYISL